MWFQRAQIELFVSSLEASTTEVLQVLVLGDTDCVQPLQSQVFRALNLASYKDTFLVVTQVTCDLGPLFGRLGTSQAIPITLRNAFH